MEEKDLFRFQERYMSELGPLGLSWAEKKEVSDTLAEHQKSVFAETQCDIEKDLNEKVSETKLTRLALADPDYKDYVSGMVEAQRLTNQAKVKYDNCKIKLDQIQTRISYEKAKTNIR